jgi:tyrosyl-tRNA synthetase
MGKTEKGALYLDPSMVSPYEFFQYWINVPDSDVGKFLRLFTFLPLEEIEELTALKGRESNRAKERLAFELTAIVHGRETAEKARETSKSAFGDGTRGGLESMPSFELKASELEKGINVVELFARSGLCSSKSDARRLVEQGGAYVNDRNIGDIEAVIGADQAQNGMIVLRAGKKRFYRALVSGG